MSPRIVAHIVFPVALFMGGGARAQYVVRGSVLDASLERPLAGANVFIENAGARTLTDANGLFELECGGAQEVALHVSFVGYTGAQLRIRTQERGSAQRVTIRLDQRTIELPDAAVHAPGPEVVFQRTDLHVGAYHVNSDGLWVLVYDRPQLWHREERAGEQVLRGARLYLLDTLFNELAQRDMPSFVHGLHTDHGRRTIIEGMAEAWVARKSVDGIELGRMDLATLRDAILPWTDSLPDLLLGNNRDVTFPAFDHFARDLSSAEDRVFCSVVDEFTLQLFRSEYKYMSGPDKVIAMDLALDTGIDAEIIAGYMTGFPKNLYFHAPYAPLFVVNDTLTVFDHYRGSIRRYTSMLVPVDEVPIGYQRDREWDELLLQDAVTDAVHVVFKRNARTWIRRVDPATGALGASTMLTNPYPEEMQVYGGYVYYVYRPYGSLQKRTLYREIIR